MIDFFDARPFGAVVADIDAEARSLVTIQIRNERVSNNPLSDYFLTDIFGPAEKCLVYSLRPDWREATEGLHDLIERIRAVHWERIPGPVRSVYEWRQRVVDERQDYPAWAHRTATNLMRRASSVFQHAGEAGPDTGNLLYLARYGTVAPDCLTDAQLLAGLAIKEAASAARILVAAIVAVEHDKRAAGLLKLAENPEFRDSPKAWEILEANIHRVIDEIARDRFYPELADVTSYRIHAEKLLMLADICSAGGLMAADASRLLGVMEQRAAEDSRLAQERKEQNAQKVERMVKERRKLDGSTKALIAKIADRMRREEPAILKKDLYSDIGAELRLKHGIDLSESSIKRGLRIRE
jgi:hypothetical protein